MPKLISLRKVQSNINKKRGKGSKSLIEKSRDAQRLQRAALREGRLKKSANLRTKAQAPKLQRCIYFQELAESKVADEADWPVEEVVEQIEKYVCRNDEEIQALADGRRPGRPPTSHEDNLLNSVAREREEFKTGYEIPDIFSKENLTLLLNWKKDVPGLSRLKMIRVSSSHQVLPST